jgi:hypothetical protein
VTKTLVVGGVEPPEREGSEPVISVRVKTVAASEKRPKVAKSREDRRARRAQGGGLVGEARQRVSGDMDRPSSASPSASAVKAILLVAALAVIAAGAWFGGLIPH